MIVEIREDVEVGLVQLPCGHRRARRRSRVLKRKEVRSTHMDSPPPTFDLDLQRPQSSIFSLYSMPYKPDEWIEQLRNCEHLSESDMTTLCDRVKGILLEESNIQPVSSPVTICGDIHGQFWDLLELLRKGGEIPETSYIFMARRLCVLSVVL